MRHRAVPTGNGNSVNRSRMRTATAGRHRGTWTACWQNDGIAYRPTWVEISQPAFRANLKKIQRHVGAKTHIIAVVKANAYGHQAVPLARCAIASGAAMLGVSSIEEGVALRDAGVTAPVLILGSLFPLENLAVALRYGLLPTISSYQGLMAYARCARRAKTVGGFHLKIDTGMGRIGVSPANALRLIDRIAALPAVRLDGIYTHFSCADTDAACTCRQQEAFAAVVAHARAAGMQVWAHAANSAAVFKRADLCWDAVRPGISLYGLEPYEGARTRIPVTPVLSWKTRIVFIKRVPRGRSISYGATCTTRRPSVIATLPVGYADGYNRLLSNKASVLVRGVRCPVVGRVTMDMMMVDVTGVPDVAIGDETVLVGRQSRERMTVEELARLAGTISYEITCAISARVPRVLV